MGDTKWDRVIKIMVIRVSAKGTCSHSDLYKTLDIWHLDQYTQRLADILVWFAFNFTFIDIDYFLFTHKILDEINFDDFDIWQNVDDQDLIERI